MLIKDGTMTQQMNEVLYEQMQETDKLLNDDVLELIKGIKPIKPEFYYNRLIKKYSRKVIMLKLLVIIATQLM